MSEPVTLQRDFGKMVRDFPRNQLPQGTVWNMVDWIPREGAPLRGRGGWVTAADVTATVATASRIVAGIYAPFTAAAQNLALDEDGNLVKFTAAGTVTNIGAVVSGTPKQNPVFHADYVIFPSNDGSTAPKRYNGSAVANLGGSPPAAQYATVWGDYTLLANTAANPRRLFFSEPGDPNATWDTTYSIKDFSRPVRGLAALKNAILVFHDDAVSRLRGDTPPPDLGMTADDPMFQVGVADARSIVAHADYVYWCSTEGVFRSDGTALEDLTKRGDMTQYWQDLLLPFTSSYTITAGILRESYFIVLMDGSTFKDAFLVDLRNFGWSRVSNLDAISMWESVSAFDELYFGRRGAGAVGSLSSIWSPASAVKNDGNSTAVLPLLESAFFEGEPGEKSWKRGYIGYQRTDYASDNPTMTVKTIRTPESTTYSSSLVTLAEQTTYKRSRFDMHFSSPGVAFKLECQNAGDTLLYSLGAEVGVRERSRLAQ